MGIEKIQTDVAVIGAGPGGSAAAQTAADAGLKTVLIDSGEIGGACLNRGCVPAKTWLAAEHLYRMNRIAGKIFPNAPEPDFKELKKHQREVIALIQKGLNFVYKRKNIELVEGFAEFDSPKSLRVNGGETVIEFNSAVIATGSFPANPFGEGANIHNSDSIFGIEELPGSIAVIGGGAVGIEMATFFSGMGCETSVIEALNDILPTEDEEVSSTVKRELKRAGVKFHLGLSVKEAGSDGKTCKITLEDGSDIESETLLVAAGRSPSTERLNLANAEIVTDVRGYIKIDETMATSREGIYAVGDVAGNALLAYTAHHEGVVASRNIAGRPCDMNYTNIPRITFSRPEAGSVGMTEKEIRQSGVPYSRGTYLVRALARGLASGETAGMVKVLAEGDGGKLLGIHIAAPGATEIIHSAAIAVSAGMTARELADTVFGHPTISEAISLAAAQVKPAN